MTRAAKKALSMFLCLALCLSAVPVSVLAAEADESVLSEEPVVLNPDEGAPVAQESVISVPAAEPQDGITDSGTCGANLTWTLTDNGTLTIIGTGAMDNYTYPGEDETPPLGLGEIQTEPNTVFDDPSPWHGACSRITSVILAGNVISIGQGAFFDCVALSSVSIPASVASVGQGAFYCCDALTDVWYGGTLSQWSAVSIGYDNAPLTQAEIHYNEAANSGVCGENLVWTYDGQGTLTVSGTGNMYDYIYPKEDDLPPAGLSEPGNSLSEEAPWIKISGRITDVVLEEGVTSVGQGAFYNCSVLKDISFPASSTSVGDGAFMECYALTDVWYGGSPSQWSSVLIGEDNIPFTQAVIHYDTADTSGVCGENLIWTLADNGTLTISGTGDMYDYSYPGDDDLPPMGLKEPNDQPADYAPWYVFGDRITEVVLEEGASSIGQGAFYDCGALTDVTIPESVVSIGICAFCGCDALEEVWYGGSPSGWNGVSIGADNAPLTSADIHYAKDDDSGKCGDNLTWAYDGQGTLTVSGTGKMYNFRTSVYPSYAPWSAFNSDITTVILEDGVTSVGNYAFYGCGALTGVTIPESLTTVGIWAFYGCSALTEIRYGGSLMGWLALSISNHNEPLTRDKVLYGKDRSTGECGENLLWTLYNDGRLVISGTGKMYDFTYPGEDDLPPAAWAEPNDFASDYPPWSPASEIIPDVIVEEGVTSIGRAAFYGCTALTCVAVPESLISVGERAFCECGALTEIRYGGSLLGWLLLSVSDYNDPLTRDKVLYGKEYATGDCGEALTWTLFNDGRLIISGTGDMYAYSYPGSDNLPPAGFSETNSFSSDYAPWSPAADIIPTVVMEDGATSIGQGAFYGCSALTDVTFPAGIASIGESAFCGCSALTDVWYGGSEAHREHYFSEWSTDNNSRLYSADWHYAMTPEEGWAYCGDHVLWQYDASARTVRFKGQGEMWDYGSSSVPWADCGGKAAAVELAEGITSLSGSIFRGFIKLTQIRIPSTVTAIGDHAFAGCTGLLSVSLPEDLKSLGEYAFAGCALLGEIDLPSGLDTICSGTFQNCTALTGIVIPESVSVIGDQAFAGCSELAEIFFPASVTEIGGSAFSDCSSLSLIAFLGSAPDIALNAFTGVVADAWYPLDLDWLPGDLQGYGGDLTWHGYNDVDEIGAEPTATVTGVSLTLKGQIGIYVYVQVPEEAATARLTYPKTEEVRNYTLDKDPSYYVAKSDQYKFLYENVPAKELTQPLELEVFDADGNPIPIVHSKLGPQGKKFTCMAVDYCNTIIENPAQPDKLKDLVKAILNYGQCAQIQFKFDTEHLANPMDYMSEEMKTVQADPADDQEVPSNAADVGWAYGTLSLKGAINANMYFTKAITAKDENGKAYKVTAKSGKYVITVENIPAKNLGDKYTVNASYGGKTATIKYSALSYINAVLGNESQPESLKELCKAIILYNKYAKAYFGN